MRIRLYDVNQATGAEVLRAGTTWLQDLYPEGGDEYEEVAEELRTTGRAWIGGGARPLMLAHKETS